jgi:hypothetical protein
VKLLHPADVGSPLAADHLDMLTGSPVIDAELAFARANRARRLARLRRRACRRLPVLADRPRREHGRREIPLEQIRGTVEPFRSRLFDSGFRPTPAVRERWQRVWLAEARGTVLPPITVVPVDHGYAVRDGHHRVSVAQARGAVAIDAIVESL